MTEMKSWVKENSTLLYFLLAQFVAVGAIFASGLAYMVKLETRVHTMETRGAEYTVARMEEMKQRIAVLENKIDRNEDSINRIINIMTKELHISPTKP